MIMSLKMCLILKSKLALVKKGQSLERTGDPTQKPKNADREWDLGILMWVQLLSCWKTSHKETNCALRIS